MGVFGRIVRGAREMGKASYRAGNFLYILYTPKIMCVFTPILPTLRFPRRNGFHVGKQPPGQP